jgi:hypothetical protein
VKEKLSMILEIARLPVIAGEESACEAVFAQALSGVARLAASFL